MLEAFNIEILGLNLAGVRHGNPNGPTILAMHGWLDNCMSFKPLLPFMQDFNFIAFDFSGHGLSDHRSQDCYLHFIDYINDVAFILKKLNIKETFLLGHSLGGSIAALFAGLFPEYVKGVFIIDSLGPVVAGTKEQMEMIQRAAKKYLDLNNKNLKVFSTINEAIDARAKASPMKADSLELLVTRNLKAVDGGFSWGTDPRLLIAPNTAPSEESVQAVLKEIRSPVSLIIPNHGWEYEENFFSRRQTCIKNLTTHHLSGGHHVHMDSPEIVGPLINDFFMQN